MDARARIEARLQAAWQQRGLLAWLLAPLALLHGAVLAVRRRLYASGLLRVTRLPVPVIVVGNLYAGGTGKTPIVLALVEALRARGQRPGVIARGHGAADGAARLVEPGGAAAAFGDEPLLVARTTGVPVAVGHARAAAGQRLLAAHPELTVLVADDGLQHLALARDIELAVVDARGHGNGWLLPAGPLREAPERLGRVDAVLLTQAAAGPATAAAAAAADQDSSPAAPAPTAQAAIDACSAAGPVPRFALARRLGAAFPLGAAGAGEGPLQPAPHSTVTLASLAAAQRAPGMTLAAAAGIAQPQAFFAQLRAAGLTLAGTLALPDHFDYRADPFATLTADRILITAKDAVKCARFDDGRLWVVPLQIDLPAALLDLIEARLAARAPDALEKT